MLHIHNDLNSSFIPTFDSSDNDDIENDAITHEQSVSNIFTLYAKVRDT